MYGFKSSAVRLTMGNNSKFLGIQIYNLHIPSSGSWFDLYAQHINGFLSELDFQVKFLAYLPRPADWRGGVSQ